MDSVFKWIVAWFGILLLPFVLVYGSYAAIAHWNPGVVRREVWAGVSEALFYIAILSMLYFVYASKINRFVGWPLAALATILFAGVIWSFQFVPLCGPFVGTKPMDSRQPAIRLASC